MHLVSLANQILIIEIRKRMRKEWMDGTEWNGWDGCGMGGEGRGARGEGLNRKGYTHSSLSLLCVMKQLSRG